MKQLLTMDSIGVAYASTALTGERGNELLSEAINALISTNDNEAQALWSLSYEQHAESSSASTETSQSPTNVLKLQDPPLDFAFDDVIIENVQAAWQKILPGADDFMVFRERGDEADDEETEEA